MLSDVERRFPTNLLEWGQENRREYPWRESNRTLYEVFVAEFFLTQTPVDNVAAVYPSFLERFPTLDTTAKPVRMNSSKLSSLLDFGALLCQPEPLCEKCFANKYCAYFQELARALIML